MAHDASKANDAFKEALPAVAGSFTTHGVTPRAIIINVVFEDTDGNLWAVGSTPEGLEEVAVNEMMFGSIMQTADEVTEAHP